MADLAGDPETPTIHNDDGGAGFNDGSKSIKRQRPADDDDDDDGDGKGRERRKIDIKFINDKSRRHITFSKRKAGIMKKVSTPSQHHSCRRLNSTRRDLSRCNIKPSDSLSSPTGI